MAGTEPVTTYEEIADAVLTVSRTPLPHDVSRAARRTLVNVLGVALGAAGSGEVTRLAAAVAVPARVPHGIPVAPGVAGLAAAADAALVTGFAAHLDDFDDTHLATVIHPGAAGLGAAWAVTATTPRPGPDLLAAYAVGAELQLRLGVAVSPEHYDRGWHITGTCGVIGAAVTAALLLGAGRDRLADTLRTASTMTLGHREAFGTEVKPFHAGKAAANGVLAALAPVTGASAHLPDAGPLLRAFAPAGPHTDLLDGLGTRWELLSNTFKPYPCGIVAHPGIDAAVRAHRDGVDPARIRAVGYRCHPLVPELMGRRDPDTGLGARFAAVHGVAVGLLFGVAGLAQFDDATATDPTVRAMRDAITLRPDGSVPRDAARLDLELDDGRVVTVAVDHARGSLARPLTDAELLQKTEALAPGRGEALWAAVERLTDPSTTVGLPDLVGVEVAA